MKSKRLNWSYSDDYFTKKSSVFEKVFQDSPSPQKTGEKPEIPVKVEYELFDYDTEDFETLRNNILLTKIEPYGIPQLIAVTCSNTGEGVTTVAANLAITMAKHADGPVLYVDTNFPNPLAHKVFGVDFMPGLGNIFVDGLESSSAIQNSPVTNLHILTTGDIKTNPNAYYETQMFYDLLKQWRLDYKFVIFDTPPMQCDMKQCDMNFPIHLASLIDGTIIVIEAEAVRREVAIRVIERLNQADANILGAVLNKRKYYIPTWLYKTL